MSLIGWDGTLPTWVLDDVGGADGAIKDAAFRYRQGASLLPPDTPNVTWLVGEGRSM